MIVSYTHCNGLATKKTRLQVLFQAGYIHAVLDVLIRRREQGPLYNSHTVRILPLLSSTDGPVKHTRICSSSNGESLAGH